MYYIVVKITLLFIGWWFIVHVSDKPLQLGAYLACVMWFCFVYGKLGEWKMTKRINPLFSNKEEKNQVVASEPVQANRNNVAMSPISGKPMQKVSCDGIEAYYDADNRLVLPIMEN